nr:phosphatidylglycerol lysyltransferase domain-containing protein [uncultured Desulfobulbus sp.]
MIPQYPESCELTLKHRPLLHPLFQQLRNGISEFTFANIYLFRKAHNYRLTRLADTTIALLGQDKHQPFFMLPFGLPDNQLLAQLFHEQMMLKAASSSQAERLTELNYRVLPDRDNFDYLYRRQDLAVLGGRSYHKKRNLIKAFVTNHNYAARPLREEFIVDALQVLVDWRAGNDKLGDYEAAREALEHVDELQLCGGIYYVDERPVAYTLGEELAGMATYLIHFEKAVSGYKGLYQFINQSFASVLPEDYESINREQDMGDQGLRQAKLSYKPTGFIEKFKVFSKDFPLSMPATSLDEANAT